MPLLIQTSWNHRVAFFTTSSWRAALSGREPSGKPFSSGGRGQGHPHPRSHPLKAFAWSKSQVYQCHAILCLQVFWGTAIGATLWKPHWHQGNPRYLLPFSHQLSKQIPQVFFVLTGTLTLLWSANVMPNVRHLVHRLIWRRSVAYEDAWGHLCSTYSIPCAKCPPVVRTQIGEDGTHQGADESHAHKTRVPARCQLSFSVIFSLSGQICGGWQHCHSMMNMRPIARKEHIWNPWFNYGIIVKICSPKDSWPTSRRLCSWPRNPKSRVEPYIISGAVFQSRPTLQLNLPDPSTSHPWSVQHC